MIDIIILNSTWAPTTGTYENTLVLYADNWNDYGYRTLYHVVYFDSEKNDHEIGDIKIYNKSMDEKEVREIFIYLKSPIIRLSSDFCSLGQSLNYYSNLKEFLSNEYTNILNRMRDIAINRSIREEFIYLNGVRKSLLRESSAEKAMREAYIYLRNNKLAKKSMSFQFEAFDPYCENSTRLTFHFDKNENLPYRINAIVGKNGVGKTQLLTKLADSLSGFTDDYKSEKSVFIDERPPFDRVLSISYSAFDSFKKKRGGESLHSYVYCGIQSEEGTLKLEQLQENFVKALEVVKARKRYDSWRSVIGELMEEDHKEVIARIERGDTSNINWSSGQHILISTITELLANIEKESIILFDEPEIHLHPNAIANVMRMFNKLLNEFDSYAIFATHSPIILQELPSRNIQIVERVNNEINARTPEIECFGENITQIINDVFDVSARESCYKRIMKRMSKNLTEEEVIELFNNRLSINAMIFLESLY